MTLQLPQIQTKRLLLRLATPEDVPAIIKYYNQNKIYLTPFYPTWTAKFFTRKYWQREVDIALQEFIDKRSLRLCIFPKESTVVIGVINFRDFVRSSAQSCTVGYSIAEKEQGKGYMTEAMRAAIKYVFHELNIHRVMANYMPHNQRSGNLLKKLGFVVEGYARDYLLIDGQWQDHILTSLVNPDWEIKNAKFKIDAQKD